MSPGAWVTLVSGAILLYGSLICFIFVAIERGKERAAKDGGRTQDEENRPPIEESTGERCY